MPISNLSILTKIFKWNPCMIYIQKNDYGPSDNAF